MSVRLDFDCAACAKGASRLRVERASAGDLPAQVACERCGARWSLELARITKEGGLAACAACGHPELYGQKDFPRAAGIAIVVAAAVLAPFTSYLSLGAAALIDALLYRACPDVVVCYVCGAAHRGFRPEPPHPRFDREIAERLRYGPRAVMGKPMRPGGTAGAPEPEH